MDGFCWPVPCRGAQRGSPLLTAAKPGQSPEPRSVHRDRETPGATQPPTAPPTLSQQGLTLSWLFLLLEQCISLQSFSSRICRTGAKRLKCTDFVFVSVPPDTRRTAHISQSPQASAKALRQVGAGPALRLVCLSGRRRSGGSASKSIFCSQCSHGLKQPAANCHPHTRKMDFCIFKTNK